MVTPPSPYAAFLFLGFRRGIVETLPPTDAKIFASSASYYIRGRQAGREIKLTHY
jgi:hypothetical protein